MQRLSIARKHARNYLQKARENKFHYNRAETYAEAAQYADHDSTVLVTHYNMLDKAIRISEVRDYLWAKSVAKHVDKFRWQSLGVSEEAPNDGGHCEMSGEKWTSGEWVVEDGYYRVWTDAGGWTPLADCNRQHRAWGCHISDEEHEANAHLMATSKKLYWALSDLVQLFDGYQGMEMKEAKAALAAARGEEG